VFRVDSRFRQYSEIRLDLAPQRIRDNPTSVKRLACALVIATAVVACRQSVEPPVDVSISMSASSCTAHRGDTVSFVINAAGNNLFGVAIELRRFQYRPVFDRRRAVGTRHLQARLRGHGHLHGASRVVTDALAGEKRPAPRSW
jgi:hypothetical protein